MQFRFNRGFLFLTTVALLKLSTKSKCWKLCDCFEHAVGVLAPFEMVMPNSWHFLLESLQAREVAGVNMDDVAFINEELAFTDTVEFKEDLLIQSDVHLDQGVLNGCHLLQVGKTALQ